MRRSALLLIAAAAVFGQDSPEARSILNVVEQASQSGRSYRAEFKANLETQGTGMQQKMDFSGTVLFQPPGKIRMEMSIASMPILMVSDGKTAWSYMSSLKQYMKLPGTGGRLPGGMGMDDLTGADVSANLQSARILREDSLSFDGGPVACYVIAAEYKPASAGQVSVSEKSSTLWIDKIKYRVLRRQEEGTAQSPQIAGPIRTKMEFTLTKIAWDPTVSADDFTFTPPEGATEMKVPSRPGGSTAPAAVPVK